jgi:phosphohistidine phosphatase
MRLLIIRHGIAVEPGTAGMPDNERPLTAEGEKKFRRAARGLARIEDPPAEVLTSPLPRARKTAEIAAEAWGGVAVTDTAALVDGDLEALEQALTRHPAEATVAVVGHEPHVSALLGHLLGTAADDRLGFKKGGVALVELHGELDQGGQLLWFAPPRILRELAD